jgi:hypothetical protein
MHRQQFPLPLHPADAIFDASVIHQEFIRVDSRGHRTFAGAYLSGGSVHAVTISRRRAPYDYDFDLSPRLQNIIDAEPGFLDQLFTLRDGEEIVTVSARYECTLSEILSLHDGLDRLPPWVAIRQCMRLVLKLHRLGLCHPSLGMSQFVVVDTGSGLQLRLRGLENAAEVNPEDPDDLPRLNLDLRRLGNLIEAFMALIRQHGTDWEDERFPLLDDMVTNLLTDSRLSKGNLELLLSHPAVQPYERSLALAIAVSDAIATKVEGNPFGFSLLGALDKASGTTFFDWFKNFDIPGIHLDYRSHDPVPLEWNQLDRLHSLQGAVRVLRNRAAHYVASLASGIGEVPVGFTNSWIRAVPELWNRLWAIATSPPFYRHFKDYLRELE